MMRKSRKVISLLLSLIMVMTTFVVAAPMLLVNAADTTIDGVSQSRVVETTDELYKRRYAGYASDYLNGASEPTDIVVPGLLPKDDYVIQGMTYYPQKDWILVTGYRSDKNSVAASSKVFCLDAVTGEFVAMISFLNVPNAEGIATENRDHGGGIAISENNIYYSCGDQDRKIAYAPLSAIEDIAVGEHRVVQLKGEHTFYEIGSVKNDKGATAYSAYVCYDQGVLWMGNFYDDGTLWGLAGATYAVPAHNSYNSMVFGYTLSGSNSDEEWANLISGTANCQGKPSYVIGLDNNIIDVQYAAVDNGKLYLSRSYGTGTDSSANMGFARTSFLTVADIDLSTPGTTSISFAIDEAGNTNTINTAYNITNYTDYPMMAMSEGLCVIEDYVYITFEGASNKYLNEWDGGVLKGETGNCEEPVDVVWKVDQYELMGEERPNEERAVHYEQVMEKSQIKDGEEYIIAYESDEIDPATLKPYLYLLDSNGGYKDYKLSKRKAVDTDGYAGSIGFQLLDYSIEDGKLYFYDADNDEIPGIRWTITGANSGNLRMQNASTYFSEFRNFYFDSSVIAMAADDVSGLSNMFIDENGEGDGGFYIRNGGYYLWCNDGVTSDYTAKANAWYTSSTNAMYSGVTETKGTFHCDALNTTGANLIGKQVADADHRTFYIFKRVVDEYVSTKDSRVHTNMNAELQADGTYTIDLETYATGELQYQILEEQRPTDFIFVLDASGSMVNDDYANCSGYRRYKTTDTLKIKDAFDGDICKNPKGTGVANGGNPYSTNQNIFMLDHYDGSFKPIQIYINTVKYKSTWDLGITVTEIKQMYWAFFKSGDGYCYVTKHSGGLTKMDEATLKSYVQNGTEGTESGFSTVTNNNASGGRQDCVIHAGVHYEYFSNKATRLECMQTSMNKILDSISDNATSTGLDHRVAIVQFGSDADDAASGEISNTWRNTGMYNNTSTTMVQYTGSNSIAATNYANAFYTPSQFGTVRDIVWNIDASTGDPDTYSNYGFEMAKNIILNSGNDYLATGDRSVAIIMLTDGVPGRGGSNSDSANTVADAAIAEAYVAKNKGANIYSVQMGNNSIENFSMNLYMEAVSSEYVTAKSTLDLGEKNPNDVDYHIDIPNGTENMFEVIAENIYNSVQEGSVHGLAKLNMASYLREQLTDAFIIPEDYKNNIKYTLTPGSYDKIGRLSWGEPVATTGFTTQVIPNTRTIIVSGYDYSDKYIGKLHPGEKLNVTITGVLANKDADITNTSINETSATAIYADVNWFNNGRAFKYFPTKYFNIPEYTYVLDYGFEMLDTEVNGTLCSVSDGPTKQVVADYEAKLPYTQKSANGLVAITDENQNLLYTTTPTNFADSGFCLIKRETGRYDWFSIKVVPASNVLFEENYVVDKVEESNSWAKDGDPVNTRQSIADDETDVYGYDAVYETTTNDHSNGSAIKTSVKADAKRSTVKSFDFIGEGFDLISACGPNTGIMAVSVKNSKGEIVKGYLIDTYYSAKDGIVDLANANGLVCQVPVINYKGSHDTYTVETTALYLSTATALKSVVGTTSKGKLDATTGVPVSEADAATILASYGLEDLAKADLELVWFDDNSILNGGSGAKGNINTRGAKADGSATKSLDCYIDGFRIYTPMSSEKVDYIEKEQNATYHNVIKCLNENHIGTETTVVDGIAYVESAVTEGTTLSFANYQQFGPQNELYLKGNGNALVIKVSVPAPTSRVHLGLRAVTGTATVKIGSTDFVINGPTEMYYDITDCVSVDGTGIATITIQNTGAGVLAVNNIKLTGDASMTTVTADDMDSAYTLMTAPAERAEVVNGVVTPVVEDTDTDVDTDTDTDTDTGSSNLSFIEQIIAKIMELLSSIFKFLPIGEVM